MKALKSIVAGFLKGRFGLLLATVALMFFVGPLVPAERQVLDWIFGLASLAVLLSCLRAISPSRRFLVFMVALSLANVVLDGTGLFDYLESGRLMTLQLGFRLLYFILVFLSIMGYVFDDSPVTGDKICGVVSAYVLMGLAWSVAYALFYHLDPACFSLTETMRASGNPIQIWAVYYSFTTLTTVGYGDIVPQTAAVQSYAILEAACGQIFLTVIVARLVALQITHRGERGAA